MPTVQRSITSSDTPPAPLAALAAIGSVVGAVVTNVGSASLVALQAVEAAVTGPPVLPPDSTVTVKSSTITLGTGQVVPADWYYPEVRDGDPAPTRMILLSHGLLALGPMYSYTAADLARRTNSIVVAPSIPSNFFAGDDRWLGGTGMAKAVAELFVGDREALRRSALDAGYAEQYGLDPANATLPRKFALAGHSLGANLVMGAAGFLADNGAAEDLVGVITLDGVPTGTIAVDALRKLDAYDARTPGDQYVPIREIGAPRNLFNSTSNVRVALSASRPNRFNGVVLDGGVHMDSMRGGNPLIQLAAFIAAGFPQPQNPPAVDELSAQWLNQWFSGQKDVGDGLAPGSTIDVDTPQGTARGVVIGTSAPFPLPWSAPTAIPTLDPAFAA